MRRVAVKRLEDNGTADRAHLMERQMSNTFKIVMGLALVSFVAACGNRQEEVVVTAPPAPIVAEPTYSKY